MHDSITCTLLPLFAYGMTSHNTAGPTLQCNMYLLMWLSIVVLPGSLKAWPHLALTFWWAGLGLRPVTGWAVVTTFATLPHMTKLVQASLQPGLTLPRLEHRAAVQVLSVCGRSWLLCSMHLLCYPSQHMACHALNPPPEMLLSL